MHKTELIGTTLAGIILFSGCSSATEPNMSPITETVPLSSPTTEITPTLTASPTSEATPTEESGEWEKVEVKIDMEMFHNVPVSYEYVLAHPNEFVNAPPFEDKENFKKWIDEQLIPALGPKSEREINLVVAGLGNSEFSYTAQNSNRSPLQGELGFFVFEYQGVKVPTLCINVARPNASAVEQTFCTGLFNGSQVPFDGTKMLKLLSDGGPIVFIDIYKVPSPRDIPLGPFGESFVNDAGGDYINMPDNIAFGLGLIGVTGDK